MTINTPPLSFPLVWDKNFDTEVGKVDEQHKVLVNLLNEAAACPEEKVDKIFLNKITGELLDYAIYHFETEEALMTKYGYLDAHPTEARQHLRQHRDFSKQVLKLRGQIKQGHLIGQNELLSFLAEWLIQHILGIDKHLTHYIIQQQLEDNQRRSQFKSL